MTTNTKIIIGVASGVVILTIVGLIISKKAKDKKEKGRNSGVVTPVTVDEVKAAILAATDPSFVFTNPSVEYLTTSLNKMTQDELRYVKEVSKYFMLDGKKISDNEIEKVRLLAAKYGIY